MLIEKDAIIKALELVKVEDFYKEVHSNFRGYRRIKRYSVRRCCNCKQPLKNNPMYTEAGGSKYLVSLIDNAQTAANVEYYAG
jgi:replicative DNA helicase